MTSALDAMQKADDWSARLFWPKVRKTEACWIWTGAMRDGGYGHFSGMRFIGTNRAHRVAWILAHGPIPDGLVLDHLCRNRACVNPGHMEPVSHAENVRRGIAGQNMASKTHCPSGHPYLGDNLKTYSGQRFCVACCRRSRRDYRARQRAARVSA